MGDRDVAEIFAAFHDVAFDVQQLCADRGSEQFDLREEDVVGAVAKDDDIALELLHHGGGDIAGLECGVLLKLEAQVRRERRIDGDAEENQRHAEQRSVPKGEAKTNRHV